MLKAMVWKEIRELLPVIVLTLLLQGFAICVGLGFQLGFISDSIRYYVRSSDTIPFIDDQLCVWLSLLSAIGTIAVGVRQTVWETGLGTFQFLFHRPMKRGAIIGTKLLIGALAALTIAAIPIVYYALWANAAGTHASPFDWSMANGMFQYCVLILLLYQGAFLSGLRSARWYGSRFLPLFAGILASALLGMASATPTCAHVLPLGWLIVGLGAFLTSAVFIAAIVHIAFRADFS